MARVLVVSAEPIGPQMAGPAIRARELARALAGEHDVHVAAPAPSDLGDQRLTLVAAGFEDYDVLAAAVSDADVVVAQQLPPRLLSRLPRLGTRLIADLYNPTVFEVLEAARDKPRDRRARQQRTVTLALVAQLAAASQVICASEKQRDLWLGVMAARGLVDVAAYEQDPTLRSVIDVVPFGLPSEPPRVASPPPIRAMFDQIAPQDRIVLWGGGVWNWLDPQTAIDAAGIVEARRGGGPRTHLVFMGIGRPATEELDAMSAVDRMLEHLAASGLEGRVVHVNHGWTAYAERGAWLLEADAALCAHHDHLETRFAFRTRMLDALWAGLPVVTTRGDTLADVVEADGLGATVPPGDAAALAAAVEGLLGDPARLQAAAAAAARLAPSYTWDRACGPLRAFISAGQPAGGGPHPSVLRRATLAQYPPLLAETRDAVGFRGAAARALRNLRRGATPGR